MIARIPNLRGAALVTSSSSSSPVWASCPVQIHRDRSVVVLSGGVGGIVRLVSSLLGSVPLISLLRKERASLSLTVLRVSREGCIAVSSVASSRIARFDYLIDEQTGSSALN